MVGLVVWGLTNFAKEVHAPVVRVGASAGTPNAVRLKPPLSSAVLKSAVPVRNRRRFHTLDISGFRLAVMRCCCGGYV